MSKGKFIVIEGIDGAGKTTITTALNERMVELGYKTVHVGTSTTTEKHSSVATFIKDEMLSSNQNFSADTQGLLYCAAINDLVDTHIRPNIETGVWVLCERFTLSTRVYQAASTMTTAILEVVEQKIKPDLTVIIDIPPEVCAKRCESSGKDDYFESASADTIATRRRLYRSYARNKRNVVIVDGTKSVDSIVNEIISLWAY